MILVYDSPPKAGVKNQKKIKKVAARPQKSVQIRIIRTISIPNNPKSSVENQQYGTAGTIPGIYSITCTPV